MIYTKLWLRAFTGRKFLLSIWLGLALAGFSRRAQAQLPPPPDYTNALWSQAYPGHWYTSRPGHYFCVIHDMEGYYESVISFFQQSGTQASIHYCVNSLKNGNDKAHNHVENNPADAPAGEITQMVREAYWAWHVLCWNGYTYGTEHEGFVDSPVWYSEAMYQASAKLQQHLCNAPDANTAPIPEDRNHIIGHNEWQNPAWTSWMATNWPQIDTTCNNHTDPGQYWNWTHFMQLVSAPNILAQPANQVVLQGFPVTIAIATSNTGTNNPTSYQWLFNSNVVAGATNASLTITNLQLTNAGTYALRITNAYNLVMSSNVTLTVAASVQNLAVVARPRSATITWSTPVPGSSQLAYGTTPGYGIYLPLDTNQVTDHAVLLTGLQTNTVYYFQVTSVFNGGVGTATGSFSTDISIIVPNAQALYSGVWVNDTSATDRYSTPYKYASVTPPAMAAQATFRPTLATPGQYDVYLWYSEGANRSAFAPVTIGYSGGAAAVLVNETVPGGNWHLVAASVPLDPGTNGYVRLANNSNGEVNKIVIADAVRWVYSPAQDAPSGGSLPVWWSQFYFSTDLLNSADPGANGYSLLANYTLGLSPVDPLAQLSFNLRPVKGGFQARFAPFQNGCSYQLQVATNLASPVWVGLTNLPLSVTNGQGTIAYTNAVSNGPAYFRLSVLLGP